MQAYTCQADTSRIGAIPPHKDVALGRHLRGVAPEVSGVGLHVEIARAAHAYLRHARLPAVT